MKSILMVAKDQVDEIRMNYKPELLKEIFNLRTKEWKYSQMSIEGGTVDIFGDLHSFKYSSYNLIPSAVDIVLAQEETELFATSLSLLHRCIEESDTTEMPDELSKQWNKIGDKADKLQSKESILLWNSICKWYRVHPKH